MNNRFSLVLMVTSLVLLAGCPSKPKEQPPQAQTPTTDTMPSFVLRYPDDAGTIMGNPISKAGYTELTGSTVKTITLDADTKITAYGFGYNEDRSNFGSATADTKSQFSVVGSVTAVRVG